MEILSHISTAALAMAILCGTLAALLALANRWLSVEEDPRLEAIGDLLPQANCGGCGVPGCGQFARELLAGRADITSCNAATTDALTRIAVLLGTAIGTRVRKVARLACAGGSHVARQRAHYEGLPSCRAAQMVSGGNKACSWGCLGLGDCKLRCRFDAISLDAHGLPVIDPERCTACGDCVDACPRALITLEPLDHRLWVACRNRISSNTATDVCEVACTACGRCVADAAPGLIRLEDGLAVIAADQRQARRDAISRCPTGAIVWLATPTMAERGTAACPIRRREALPVDPARAA
ncbi:4Fe-4S binding protein [Laribacter hongkongensis]|uniref:(Fe-S)-binding protein n=1 Tax=Laribacter hongkongensis TaxID=168471 RepID=UPI001EFE12BA|nr:(Fe-S)-binding protein [Laribacter hongkongensis]MCG9114885.1 4Fe-4S binding protein [Laribacter hongkongensis]